jgi:DnaD/phage-associated family protein
MSPFSGFNTSTGKNTPIPAAFFIDLLPQVTDLDELRVILWAFRSLDQQQGDLRYLTMEDFFEAEEFIPCLGKTEKEQKDRISKALEGSVRLGVLLQAESADQHLYFLNSPRGRAALEGLSQGAWQPEAHHSSGFSASRPNIFALYEQNIGPLTPLLADELRDAESQYPAEWIADAFKIAVTRNARNWRYIEAILRAWKEKGRDERDQRSTQEDRKLDSEGQYGDYILH